MNNRNPLRRQGGFTILEIVIVFILLASLMSFVGPKIFEQMGRAKSSEAKIRIQQLAGQIEMYKLEVGRYPDNLQALHWKANAARSDLPMGLRSSTEASPKALERAA